MNYTNLNETISKERIDDCLKKQVYKIFTGGPCDSAIGSSH